jgi:Rrf2 family protein
VSRKCEYALRAIFELARQPRPGPRKIQEIARAQRIPPRFLEVILIELKNAGFVLSRRGTNGGYMLARQPRAITVGQIIRLFYGRRRGTTGRSGLDLERPGDVALARLWRRTEAAISEVYDQTTFEDLIMQEMMGRGQAGADYVI